MMLYDAQQAITLAKLANFHYRCNCHVKLYACRRFDKIIDLSIATSIDVSYGRYDNDISIHHCIQKRIFPRFRDKFARNKKLCREERKSARGVNICTRDFELQVTLHRVETHCALVTVGAYSLVGLVRIKSMLVVSRQFTWNHGRSTALRLDDLSAVRRGQWQR